MSDYLFMLENHLDAGQSRVLTEMQRLATAGGMSVWLAGGAMRDMFRGVLIRDLDFCVERDAMHTGAALAAALGAQVAAKDKLHRWVELELPGGIRASVSNIRTETRAEPGGKPEIGPATIHEDLRRRDFTINAIALSLNRGSRGLLIDPTNGQADLENHELRAANPFALFDDPSRIFRLFRFRYVYGFNPVPRLLSQLENALLEDYAASAPRTALANEIRKAAAEPTVLAMIEALEAGGLMKRIHASLTGPKLNLAGIERFNSVARSAVPFGTDGGWAAFLKVLVEKLNAKEQAGAVAAFDPSPGDMAVWTTLDEKVQHLEAEIGAGSKRPSQIYECLAGAGIDEILLLLYRTSSRAVPDRVQAFYEKFLPAAQEITDEQVAATGAKPGTPKFEKAKRALIAAALNAKPKKAEAVEAEEEVEEAEE